MKITIDGTTKAFLAHLWRGGGAAYWWYLDEVETYTDKDGVEREKKRSVWFPVERLPAFVNPGKTEHTFFGIHPTHEQRKNYQRSDVKSIAAVNCLFCEFDGNVALDYVLSLHPQPSYVSESSPGKYHAYWLLTEPYYITSDESRKHIQTIQYAWVDYCGGDDASKDLARVLRVPGTRNVKGEYAPEYPTVSWVHTEGVTYRLGALYDACEVIIAAAQARPPKPAGRLLDAGTSVIDEFNNRYSIEQCLRQYGYEQRGNRWVRPGGSRALVVVKNGKSYHHSGDDPMSGGYWRSPFDLFCHYDHGGDVKAAVKAAAAALGLNATERTVPVEVKQEDTESTTETPENGTQEATEDDGTIGALRRILAKAGYDIDKLARNEVTARIEYDGKEFDDTLAATWRVIAYDRGLKNASLVNDAITMQAANFAYHPIKQYLENLPEWDGKDYIAQVAEMIACDGMIVYNDGAQRTPFHAFLTRWLVGAVRRVYTGEQNPMLVLVGKQWAGKSSFVRWLASGVDRTYYTEQSIQPENKDHRIAATRMWVWEVAELDATTRRADVEALKAFITAESFNERLPYARHEVALKPLASFIGTLNNTQYLADPTGNRRFNTVQINDISLDYRDIPVDQLWAQAYRLYQQGVDHMLCREERAYIEAKNADYTADAGFEGYIGRYLAPDDQGRMEIADIADHINENAGFEKVRPSDIRSGMLKRSLVNMGYEQPSKVESINGRKGRFWRIARVTR